LGKEYVQEVFVSNGITPPSPISRRQLRVLEERVRRKREIFESYRRALGDLPGVAFMPEVPWGRHNRWPACA